MEADREIANLGPDVPIEDSQPQQRQPRRRFIGRRAAAEKAASGQNGQTIEGDGALAAPKVPRNPRTLHQIPDSILHDDSLNEAIAHLPSNYNFEIHKTVHRIRTLDSKNVALQFPEGLLMFAPLISDILTAFCPGTETLIMGDVTYGACCIDDYTARALGCDLLVHYGHSCLVPVDTTKIKTLYVFVTIGIDVEHLIKTIERNFQSGKRVALVGTIQFNATLHSILPRLRSLGYDPFLPRSAPLSAGEILGCTAPSLVASSRNGDQESIGADADMILYVGDGRFHLESIMIASPSLRAHTYRYDPYSRRLTHEEYEHKDMHTLRRQAIQTARKTLKAQRQRGIEDSDDVPIESTHPQTWAIVLGTLGRQGNPNTLNLITAHLDRLGIPWITLLLSEVFPQKLAMMSRDIGVWVQVACPRLSIDWGYAFERPLLSPYEALVALDVRGADWEGKDDGEVVYPMDYYEKSGLGRTTLRDVSAAETEIEVR